MGRNKPTYKDLEDRVAELEKKIEILRLSPAIDLSSTEKSSQLLFSNSLDGFTYCRMIYEENIPVDFVYLNVNPAFYRLTGLKDVVNRTATEVFPDIKLKNSELFQIYDSVASSGKPQKFELFFNPLQIWLSISVTSSEKGYFIAIFDDITNRKQMELIIQENEQRLNIITENIQALIGIINRGFEYIFVNHEAETFFGKKKEEIIGKPVKYIVGNEAFERALPFVEKALNGESVTYENYILNLKGEARVVQNYVSPYFQNGDIVGIIILTVDITNIKKAEQALKENEIKLKTIFDIMEVGVTITDENGDIIDCNTSSERILGISKEEHLKRNYAGNEWNVIKSDYTPLPPKEFASVRAMNENRSVCNVEMGIVKGNDKVTWISVNATPLNIKGFGVVVTYTDITELKKAEEFRAFLNRNFEAFLEQTSDIIFFKDIESRIIFCSQTLAKITGYASWKELIGKHVLDVFPSEFARIYKERDDTVLTEGIPCLNKVDPYEDENGKQGFALTNEWPVFDENNKIVGIFGISRDITERLLAEQQILKSEAQLKELNATKDKLFSIIAHDLRSPFNALLGYSQLLIKNLQGENIEKSKLYVERIHGQTTHTLNLLDNLLSWAKAQTGKIKFEPERLCFRSIINEINTILNSPAVIKNISVKYTLPDNLIVFADSYMLQTILRNLISNAIKYTNSGGKIKVGAICRTDDIQICISDNGVGMCEEVKRTLFKTTSGITTAGTEKEKGSGLGLLICKEFVEKHGGKIWVESELGVGSKFYFTLPNHIDNLN